MNNQSYRIRELPLGLELLTDLAEAYRRQTGWYNTTYPDAGLREIAYFSMEFGLGDTDAKIR